MSLTQLINERRNVIFDFEVFPEWWVCVFRDTEDPDTTFEISSETPNYVSKFKTALAKYRLIGFNIKMYDLLVLNAIINFLQPKDVYQVSQDLINDIDTAWTKTFAHYKWDWIDLFNDWKFGSLKMYEANSGLSIVETSIPFGKTNLTDDEKAEIIKYCKADTWATYKLWMDRRDYFTIHEFVAEQYNVPLRKAYQKTMQALTAEAMQAQKPALISAEDKRKDIYVLDYIDSIIHRSPFDYLLPENSEEKVFMVDGDKFYLGVGGVHSDYDEPIIVRSNEESTLYSIDVTQYYPNMLTKFKLMPRSVPQIGVSIFQGMIDKVKSLKVEMNACSDLTEAKKLKSKRDKYKVLINAVSGAMRSKYSKFYDPSRIITMCAVGQFLLISVVIEIKQKCPGVEILQTNTDGAYLLIPNKYKDEFLKIMDNVMALSKLEFEIDKGDVLIQRDVNNYAFVKGNKVKWKGSWIYDARPAFRPSLFAISHIAVLKNLLYDIPIEETIRNEKDIMNFVACAKTGKFDETLYDNGEVMTPTSNVNRFIASKKVKQGLLFKVKYDEDGTMRKSLVPNCPPNAMLLNEDIGTYNIEDLEIDYDFYIKYAYELMPNFHTFQ